MAKAFKLSYTDEDLRDIQSYLDQFKGSVSISFSKDTKTTGFKYEEKRSFSIEKMIPYLDKLREDVGCPVVRLLFWRLYDYGTPKHFIIYQNDRGRCGISFEFLEEIKEYKNFLNKEVLNKEPLDISKTVHIMNDKFGTNFHRDNRGYYIDSNTFGSARVCISISDNRYVSFYVGFNANNPSEFWCFNIYIKTHFINNEFNKKDLDIVRKLVLYYEKFPYGSFSSGSSVYIINAKVTENNLDNKTDF